MNLHRVLLTAVMSAAADDDISRLFTPPRTPNATSSLLSEPPQTPSLLVSPKARQLELYIEPPVLSSDEKNKYKNLPAEFVLSGFQFDAPDIDQVIGEYREGTDLYYFARFKDGIAHKV